MTRSGAIAIVLLVLSATSVPAQVIRDPAFDPDGIKRKNPTTARVIGVVPSAGHIYAGETTRGLAYLGGMAGVLVLGSLLLAGGCIGDLMSQDPTCPSPVVENLTMAAFFGVWGWSIYDAGRAAQRTNARRGLRAAFIVAPGRVSLSPRSESRVVRLGLGITRR